MKSFQVPPTRLPFVNMEVAYTTFEGTPHLVSSTYGHEDGGRLYFWNPDTMHHAERRLPPGIPGAYVLKPGYDGMLYLGCGNGDLVRYDHKTDKFDTLVTGELHSIIWGGCVTQRYVVMCASPGDAIVYDLRKEKLLKTFRQLDQLDPPSHYGHKVIEAPDGKIVIGMNVPEAHLLVLNLDDLTVTSHRPTSFTGARYSGPMTFLDEHTLLIFLEELNKVQLLHYPDFTSVSSMTLPFDTNLRSIYAAWVGNHYYAACYEKHDIFRLNDKRNGWEPVNHDWLAESGTMTAWEDRKLAGVTIDGWTSTLNVETGEVQSFDLESWGSLGVHSLCAVPQHGFIAGSPFINRRFWLVDMETGEGRDVGRGQPGGGQINHILWDETMHELLLFSYTTASVMGFDPSKTYEFGTNPRLIASAANQGQMRPNGAVHDGRYAWMVSNAEYGKLNGALSRIDPRTGEIKVWPGIVPEQNPTSILLDRERSCLYVASSIHPDCKSGPPHASTAEVVAFDMNTLEVVARHIVPNAASAWVVTLFDNGDVLVSDGKASYRWSRDSRDFRQMQTVLPQLNECVVDRHGTRWVATDDAIGVLELSGTKARVHPKMKVKALHLHVADDHLCYSQDNMIYCIPINSKSLETPDLNPLE